MYNNILIVKLSAIGDVIHALPAAQALKTCYPQAHITWVVEPVAAELLQGNPYIDEVLIFEKKRCKTLAGFFCYVPGFIRQLRQRRYDLSLDLQGLFKSAAIAFLSGARRRLGYCNMREGSALVSAPVCGPYTGGHVVERYLDVVRHLGCAAENVAFFIDVAGEQERATAIAAAAGLDLAAPFVVLAVGTNWSTKCWPPSHFARLADRLFAAGITPVLVGGPGEQALAQDIIAQAQQPPCSLIGKTTLKQLGYIISQAQGFVGGDTGPMHLAVAVNTPVVALFGPSNPDRNGPYGGAKRIIIADRPCVRCQKRRCEQICLDRIRSEEVWENLAAIMKGQQTG